MTRSRDRWIEGLPNKRDPEVAGWGGKKLKRGLLRVRKASQTLGGATLGRLGELLPLGMEKRRGGGGGTGGTFSTILRVRRVSSVSSMGVSSCSLTTEKRLCRQSVPSRGSTNLKGLRHGQPQKMQRDLGYIKTNDGQLG